MGNNRPGPASGMNTKVEQPQSSANAADIAKYALAILVAAGGIVAFYWFSQWPGPVRGLVAALAIAAGFVIAAFTAKGRQAREFFNESLFELRKVVWPTKQETFRLTWVILLVVVIVSLILSLFDWLISLLIQQFLNSSSWFNSLFG